MAGKYSNAPDRWSLGAADGGRKAEAPTSSGIDRLGGRGYLNRTGRPATWTRDQSSMAIGGHRWFTSDGLETA